MRNLILFLIFLALSGLGAAGFFRYNFSGGHVSELGSGTRVFVGAHEFEVEVVDTPTARRQGLSGRESLPEGYGMLFLFDQPSRQGFWMRDMHFPIDILWIYEGEVIGYERRVPAPEDGTLDRDLPTYFSPGEVDMVLEVNAGSIDGMRIGIGDEVVVQPHSFSSSLGTPGR